MIPWKFWETLDHSNTDLHWFLLESSEFEEKVDSFLALDLWSEFFTT